MKSSLSRSVSIAWVEVLSTVADAKKQIISVRKLGEELIINPIYRHVIIDGELGVDYKIDIKTAGSFYLPAEKILSFYD